MGIYDFRRSASEPVNQVVKDFYDKFLQITQHDVFNQGQYYWMNADRQELLCWRWVLGNHKRLVIVNYSNQKTSGTVKVPDAEGDVITLTDLLTGTSYQRNARELREQGLHVILDPWKAHIFEY